MKLFKRIYLNVKILNHCLKILYFYKFNKFNVCIQAIKYKKYGNNLNLRPNYLSKKINLFSGFLLHNNCLFKSMCLYSMLNRDKEIDLIIGIKKDKKDKFFSHSWIEFKGIPVNENISISKYKPIYSVRNQ